MSEMIGPGPLQELDLCNGLWPEPNTLLHFLRGESLTPATCGQLRKVCEGTLRGLQVLDPLEYLTSSRRHQARPHARRVDKILAPVETHHQGIDSQMAGHVSTNHEFLSKVDPIFAPEPCSLARLVEAVGPLCHNTLQPMVFHELQHLRCRSIRHLRKGDVFAGFYDCAQDGSAFRERKLREALPLVDQDVKGVVENARL